MDNKFIKYLKNIFTNKYLLVLTFALVWIVFFDDNNLLLRFQYDKKINDLNEEIQFYENEIKESERKMNELKSDSENLEKFAREQYLMKRKNEDLFIIE